MRSKPVSKEKALERLASLCSRSEQCEFELKRKLMNWGISAADSISILDYLKNNRYLDNTRYAKSFANDKARFSSWGPFKIKAELIKRKIESPIINEALKAIDPQIWKEAILRCSESKSKNLHLAGEDGYEDRQKLFRYLISRGFSSASSSKVVSMMKRRQEEEE